MNITNEQFLRCIFGNQYIYAHVTSFIHDPHQIPNDQRAIAWSGGYYKDTPLIPNSNQFYTVSLFVADENGRSRRRKSTFSGTYVIGLDDVREKLDINQVNRLPKPTVILKSSNHSEQWLYVLDEPCVDMNMVDNLHDGLISRGLAPDGNDPGQKGVTRYLRLPEGVNTKAKRIEENGGVAPRCEVLEFEPTRRYKIEELAAPFEVDLHAARASKSITGAANIPDHPLLKSSLTIKEVRSDGRFDITCPWVEEHTGQDDSGTAIFTNEDGTMGFKCHHGHCQDKTGRDLMTWLEQQQPGFSAEYAKWQLVRSFSQAKEDVSFLEPPEEEDILDISQLIGEIRRHPASSQEARDQASTVLKAIDSLNPIDRIQYHKEICDVMHWTKQELNQIIGGLRNDWYSKENENKGFYQDVLFIRELNKFYDWQKRIYYTAESFQNSFADEDDEARKGALQLGMVQKVDKLDYLPNGPRVWEEDGVTYGNSYTPSGEKGNPGNCDIWYNHFEKIGWGDNREHILNWMAHTIQYPEKKINHCLLLGGGEGIGKDFLLYPLLKAMGRNSTIIDGADLSSQFNDYLMSTKHLHVNETELGDHKEAMMISAKLKPLAAAPPERLRVNQKGISAVSIRNIVNVTMTTNNIQPFKTDGVSRRFYALWSYLEIRNRRTYEMKPEWRRYWVDSWNWMEKNYQNCIHFLETKDLSNFNPYEAPPMTEFLQEIVNRSKPLSHQTIEALTDECYGHFRKTAATVEQLRESINAAEIDRPDLLFTPAHHFTPARLGGILTKLGCERIVAADEQGKRYRAWSLRNHEDLKKKSAIELDAIIKSTFRIVK